MIYSSTNNDPPYAATLKLSAQEKADMEAGKPVVRKSADSKGHFKIVVKLTRPRTKKARLRGL